jgi:DNA-binding PadR family transcriptional regulator
VAGGPERRYYVMTAKGRALMRRKLAMWKSFSSAMSLVLKPAAGQG